MNAKPNKHMTVTETAPDLWTVGTTDGTHQLNLSLKDQKSAEKIAKILDEEAEADNIVWAE